MKRQTKTLVSCLLALAMLIGMTANCFAANSFTITKVEILNPSGSVKDTLEGEELNSPFSVMQNAEAVRVTGVLNDETPAAVPYGTATYLAYDAAVDAEGSELVLGDSTIEYLDQKMTDKNGSVTFTYRNRSSIAVGTAVTAKASGTSVASPAGFSYTIGADTGTITINGENEPITAGTATDVTFTLSATINELTTLSSVRLGNVDVTTAATLSEGTLTIPGATIATLSAGTYDLHITAEGFYAASKAEAVVIESSIVEIDPDDAAGVVGDIEDAVVTPAVDGSVTIPFDSTVATNGVEVTVEGNNAGKVDVNGATVSLRTGVPFAKVDLDIAITGSDKSAKKTVYMIPEGTPVSYGNLGLHTKEGEAGVYSDAFAYDPSADEETANAAFATFINTNSASILEDVAVALSIAMDPAKANELPHFDSVLDFDGDDALALAEYRIYRLLMNGNDPVHTFTAVNKARNK